MPPVSLRRWSSMGFPSGAEPDPAMTERQIRVFGDPVLKTVSERIQEGDRVEGLIEDLIDTVKIPGRAGVAAPQIGVNQRAFSYNVDGEVGYVINPVLVEVSGEPELMDEGCLSVPGFYFERLRYPFARVTGVDLDGNPVELSGSGLMAQALQHETDHLDGKLYIEGLDKELKRDAMRQIRNAPWF
ncbi:MAG: peptide deformylase [Microbacteriaceae bacterium]|jgi:peptide deformylase|nr:def [Microbacteriaceae bacterium]MDQ1553427.1 peptide deformylase [Microbacteriaceae bacterium]